MKYFYYENDKNECHVFPTGGIGTGVIGFSGDGEFCRFDITGDSDKSSERLFLSFSAEASNENKLVCRKNLRTGCADGNADGFEKSGLYVGFPFAKKIYEGCGFEGRITQTVFSPFIPHNETDSGIPCVFVEFEIENTSQMSLKYTVQGSFGGFPGSFESKAGCTDSGAVYVEMSEKGGLAFVSEGNVCLSTDAKSFSYNDGKQDDSSSVSASVYLAPGQVQTLTFAYAWYFPMRDNTVMPEKRFSFETDEEYKERNRIRNYYAQYFESSTECVDYCFAHLKRLKSETLAFADALYSSTVSGRALQSVSESLCAFRSASLLRLGNGELYSIDETGRENESFPLHDAFALSFLFPLIDKSHTSSLIKRLSGKQNADCTAPIFKSYLGFLISGDFENLVENWFSLCEFIDKILVNSTCDDKIILCIEVCAYLCKVINDGERFERCREKLAALSGGFDSSLTQCENHEQDVHTKSCDDSTELLHTDIFGQGSIFDTDDQSQTTEFDKDLSANTENVSRECEQNEQNNNCSHNEAEKRELGMSIFLEKILFENEVYEQVDCRGGCFGSSPHFLSKYALLFTQSGFDYNAYEKRIGFVPDMNSADSTGTSRCFFSLGTCYGYAERGVDYVEINILYGKLTLREFSTPTRPLMVMYGGRRWKFTDTGLCARLDSDLTLSPDKKLTVIVDVKK